jgi:hypothetical protein
MQVKICFQLLYDKAYNYANFRDIVGFSSSVTVALKDLESP